MMCSDGVHDNLDPQVCHNIEYFIHVLSPAPAQVKGENRYISNEARLFVSSCSILVWTPLISTWMQKHGTRSTSQLAHQLRLYAPPSLSCCHLISQEVHE